MLRHHIRQQNKTNYLIALTFKLILNLTLTLIFTLSLSFICALPAHSLSITTIATPQKTITPPSLPPVKHPPVLPPERFRPLIVVQKADQAIQLQKVHIQTQLAGSLGESTIQLVFFNPNNRVLEGNVEFPLSEGQSITGFSLDVNGKQRDAVPVEKAKGRQVFEEIQRRGIDPGLLEVTQGNNFKLRVYPLPAKGSRTVEIHLSHSLNLVNGQWQLPLNLGHFKDAQSSQIEIKINGTSAPATASMGAQSWQFEQTKQAQQWQLNDAQLQPKSQLLIQIPEDKNTQTFVQGFQGNTYFYSEVKINNIKSQRALPKIIGLLWDSSSSAKNRDSQAELNELDMYFQAVGNAEVRLTRLRDKPEATRNFAIKNGQWPQLRKELESTIYDGASALADWKNDPQVQEYLLFSDGLLNYGNKAYPSLPQSQRLFALSSTSSKNSASLNALAEKNGGRFISIQRENAGYAAKQLLQEGVRVLDATGNNISDVQFETMNPTDNIIRISGILRSPKSTLNLRIMQNRKMSTQSLNIDTDAPSHPLVAHLWARYRLQQLEVAPELYRGEIRRIGQQFSIPTSETSLIVLELAADYARYNIAPPEELKKEVAQLQSQSTQVLLKKNQQKLDAIASQFQAKKVWWEKDFSSQIAAYKKSQEKVKLRQRQEPAQSIELERMSMVPQASMAPAPAPALNLAEVADSRISVSGTRIASEKKDNSNSVTNSTLSINMKKWTSDAPYIRRMKEASKETIYRVYLDEKDSYTNSSAFYLDAADMLQEKGERLLALRVISNLAEMELENRAILRILAYRLMEMNAPELALPIFEKITRIADEEPQSFRDYGLALAANKKYQSAVEQLYYVIKSNWDARFVDIELISLAEMNAVIANAQSQSIQLNLSQIDARLLHNLPLDIRVVMTWDADNSDMDLWVTDPLGEKCYFGHNATAQGGRMTRDATQGYGPEEFSLRKALPGKYKIEANFYGNRQQIIAGATTLQVKLMTHFGTNKAQEKILTLRLKEAGSTVFVGEFEVK